MVIVHGRLFQSLALGQDAGSFLLVLVDHRCRRTRKVITSHGVGIGRDDRHLGMHVVNGKLLELGRFAQNLGAFCFVLFHDSGGWTRKVVASARVGVRRDDRTLRMHVIDSQLLEGASVFQHTQVCRGSFHIFELRGTVTIKVAAGRRRRVGRFDRIFGMMVHAGIILQLLGFCEDSQTFLRFLRVFGLRRTSTIKVATGRGRGVGRHHGAFRVQIIDGRLLEHDEIL